MPDYRYKCFRCAKQFLSDVRFGSVASGCYGACPKCDTVITRLNFVEVSHEEDDLRRFAREQQLVAQWLARMRNADRQMGRLTGFGRKSHVGTSALEPALERLEGKVAGAILRMLGWIGGLKREMLILALKNKVIDDMRKACHSNEAPLIVFRFYTGTRSGLLAACQGSIGHEKSLEDPWEPERERGTTTRASKVHQRGVKKETSTHASDVVSTTCSLRNLVRSSAGRYSCTPGGQVVPIFFGANHIPEIIRASYAKMFAPKFAVILIPPRSYVVDWEDFLVDSNSISTSADISFFEREVSYDTYGGQHALADEFILFVGANPFHGMLESNKSTVSSVPRSGGTLLKRSPFGGGGGPSFGGGSGSYFT